MANIINTSTLTTNQQTQKFLCGQLKMATSTLLRVYQNCYNEINKNPDYATTDTDEYGALTTDFHPELVYAAFENADGTANPLGMSADDLVSAARQVKTLLNYFQPGLVVDGVPEVTITL